MSLRHDDLFSYSDPPPPTLTNHDIQRLDAEFDQHLAAMKRYIVDLKDRKSKQLCALWIKKLCETLTEAHDGSSPSKLIRNEYSSKLLGLLENYEGLKFPFNERPSIEPLRPYNDVMERHFSQSQKPDKSNNRESRIEISRNDSEDITGSSYHILYQSSDQMIDQQLKLLETRYKEERLHLQQLHGDELQKVLDRKNGEIETLKSNFNRKKNEYEDNIGNLERKVQAFSRQIILDREAYEKEIGEFKYQSEKAHEKTQFDFDKKLNDMVSKYEKEKFDMQKSHTKAFQDLVDETNVRLRKVEAEYNQQQLINDKVIQELENRTQLLKTELEKNISLAKNLDYDNKEKQALVDSLEKRLNEEINRNSYLENEIGLVKDNRNRELNDLGNKYELMLDSKIRELQSNADALNNELKNLKQDHEQQINKLNMSIKEKENALSVANTTLKQQKSQAEQALNELKTEVERNSNKLYDDMKNQMTKIENDLDKSKSLREKQAKEFNKQIENLKSDHKKEIEKQKSEFKIEKQRIHQTHELMYAQLQNQYHQQLIDTNMAAKIRTDDLTQKICRLEQELIEANELRKQQITELGFIRQDEKMKNEHELERVRSKYEHELSGLKKRSKEEIESAREELKVRDDRIRRLNEKIRDLEDSLSSGMNENKRLKDSLEREKNDFYSTIDAERNAIKRSYTTQLMEFEKELQSEKAKYKSIEKKIKQMCNENEQNVLNLKMHYEEKLKGLLPLSIKNDYEETISALRSQVDSLKQRTVILQNEFDERNQAVNSSFTPSI